jgi:mRNA interferase HigB
MHIISKKTLQAFWEGHPVAEKPLRGWFVRVKQSAWNNFAELRQDLPSVDLVGRLVVFNIGGGNYRLVARVEFKLKRVYVRHVLTHADYDRGQWENDEWFT